MYAKIINGKIESVGRKPNWRMDDGSLISDEELVKRGRLPVHRDPPEYDGETQRLKQRSQDEWVIHDDYVEVVYEVEDVPLDQLETRIFNKADEEKRKVLGQGITVEVEEEDGDEVVTTEIVIEVTDQLLSALEVFKGSGYRFRYRYGGVWYDLTDKLDELRDKVAKKIEDSNGAAQEEEARGQYKIRDKYEPFEAGLEVKRHQKLYWEGLLWRVETSHTTQDNWTPDVSPSLFTEVAPPGVVRLWQQPTHAENAYKTGDRAKWPKGDPKVWESTIDGNTTEPGTLLEHGYWVEVSE